MATTMRERTVQFYEIVDLVNADQVRVHQRNWQSVLLEVGNAKLDERTHTTPDQTLVGTVHGSETEGDHLLLHKVKREGEWLSTMNMETGEWRELELRAAEGYLDTTVIAFLGFGNVIGLMQGSVSAPSHKSLENWINGLQIFTRPILVRALMTRAEVERLAVASGASRIEIRLGAHKAEALSKKDGRLARMLRTAAQDFGDVKITVTISVPRGGGRDDERRVLREELSELADVMPDAAEVAKANLVYANAEGGEYVRLSEFVEHHITAKRRVPTVDDQGNSVRILSAVQVIMGASAEHEDELRRAAGVQD
ncbi:hypothetical protein [Verrucosispora sp. NA02020]|uniref:hypothetical protein n=1 Tax=Verrucosispora sp. NA02020 TaxID=2742132 RepID=UPI003D721DA8